MRTIRESLDTPVESCGEVVVVGAGSAGVAAALASARQGARTTLIDAAGFPGGTLVSGIPILGCHDGKRQVVKGVFQELVEELQARDGVTGDPGRTTAIEVDTEKLKVILLEKLLEAGVQLRLHTTLSRAVCSDRKIESLVVEGKGGRRALEAPLFVDATGDADLAHLAGVPTQKGRGSDGQVQPMSLIFGVGNIDKAAFEQWGGYFAMEKKFDAVAAAGNLRNPRRGNLSGIWGARSRVGEFTFNVTRVLGADGSDARSLSGAEAEGRLQAWEFLESFLRPHVPGFRQAYIVWTAAKIGVRETRRIVGEYVLTRDDIWNFVKFADAINCGSYPIDIHSPTGSGTEFPADHFYGGRYWTIPYRSLVPLRIDNLLVAGRCLSASHEALAAVRCMANTLGMGEAAGYAAALCVHRKSSPRDLDAADVRRLILANGGWLGDGGGHGTGDEGGDPPSEAGAGVPEAHGVGGR